MAGSRGGESGMVDGNRRARCVVALAKAKREGWDILTPEQYWETVGLIRRLEDFGDPVATADLDIKPFRDFYELRVKGGFVRNINLRIYFAFVEERNEVVVLMAYKKEEDRRVSPHIYITLEDRLEDYLNGAVQGVSVFPHHRDHQSGS
jgi:hypothetical protein